MRAPPPCLRRTLYPAHLLPGLENAMQASSSLPVSRLYAALLLPGPALSRRRPTSSLGAAAFLFRIVTR